MIVKFGILYSLCYKHKTYGIRTFSFPIYNENKSYFVFYRYYATLIWWKHQQKEENTDNENLHENKDFVLLYCNLVKVTGW